MWHGGHIQQLLYEAAYSAGESENASVLPEALLQEEEKVDLVLLIAYACKPTANACSDGKV